MNLIDRWSEFKRRHPLPAAAHDGTFRCELVEFMDDLVATVTGANAAPGLTDFERFQQAAKWARDSFGTEFEGFGYRIKFMTPQERELLVAVGQLQDRVQEREQQLQAAQQALLAASKTVPALGAPGAEAPAGGNVIPFPGESKPPEAAPSESKPPEAAPGESKPPEGPPAPPSEATAPEAAPGESKPPEGPPAPPSDATAPAAPAVPAARLTDDAEVEDADDADAEVAEAEAAVVEEKAKLDGAQQHVAEVKSRRKRASVKPTEPGPAGTQ